MEIKIDKSPCFELYGCASKLVRRASLKSQRQFMGGIVIEPKSKHGFCESSIIYCIGGKGKFVSVNSIEKYLVSALSFKESGDGDFKSTDRWVEIKMQLNYSKFFPSCC